LAFDVAKPVIAMMLLLVAQMFDMTVETGF
jgi:hypothetical protein